MLIKKICAATVFFFCFLLSAQAQQTPPNILLIISDQDSGKIMTQAGYKYINTPGIDRLASEGVTFTRSYATYPVCIPSRASIMTGVMPSKSNDNLTNYPSISGHFKNKGYKTAFFGKWHVGQSDIDEVADWHQFDTYNNLRNDSRTAELTNNFLTQEHEVPFFLVTSFLNPHDCCELARNISGIEDNYHDGPVEENVALEKAPPLPDNFAIPPDEPEGFFIRRTPDSTNMRMYRKHPIKYWGEKEWRQYMYGYDRLVEKMDSHIVNIINTLEQQGELENTIIVYTSEHGDGHASHQWNQKMTFYEEAIKVPFVVSWKGNTRAGVIDQNTLVSNGLDLFPTITNLAGISPPDSLLGIDLSHYLMSDSKTTQPERKYVVSEMNQLALKRDQGLVGRMVVSDRYKYFLFDGGENPEQLFDLENDPGELQPVTNKAEHQDQLQAHRQMLRDWIKKSDDNFPAEKIPN